MRFIPKRNGFADARRQSRIRREILQPGLCQFADVRLHKRETLYDSVENFGVDPGSVMVDAGVFIRELCRQSGIPGCETRPQFTADRRAHSAGEMVVEASGPRRTQPHFQIADGNGVLVAHELHVFRPDVRQGFAADARLLHPVQRRGIHRLKLQIVIGH